MQQAGGHPYSSARCSIMVAHVVLVGRRVSTCQCHCSCVCWPHLPPHASAPAGDEGGAGGEEGDEEEVEEVEESEGESDDPELAKFTAELDDLEEVSVCVCVLVGFCLW